MKTYNSLLSIIVLYLGLMLSVVSCRKPDTIEVEEITMYDLKVPVGFPAPILDDDNPLTIESVALGKRFFYDKRFSRDQTISCASCHFSDRAFVDNTVFSSGVEGVLGERNTPTLANIVYQDRYFFDGGVPSLELQVLAPIHNELEMDFKILDLVEILNDDEEMVALSKKVYGRDSIDPYVITRAISNFERTMISGNSPYDKYVFQGDAGALTAQEIRGKELFESEELQCASCHSGFNLTDNDYHNIGLYEAYEDSGRERISFDANDAGKFKVPTLRNIELTAPYMHDGSIATLEEVIEFLNSGGLDHPNKSELIVPLSLNAEEKADLLSFLKSLTDNEFVNNPQFLE